MVNLDQLETGIDDVVFITMHNGETLDGVLVECNESNIRLRDVKVTPKGKVGLQVSEHTIATDEVEKFQLQDNDDKRSVLAGRLPLYTTWGEIEAIFRNFGVIEGIRFLAYDDLTFAKKCVVKMSSVDAIEEIMRMRSEIVLNLRLLDIKPYYPWRVPKKREKGKYKILCTNCKTYLAGCESDEKRMLRLEYLLNALQYTGIQLMKENGNFKGRVEIRFNDENDRDVAKEKLEEEGIETIDLVTKQQRYPKRNERPRSPKRSM